MTPDERYDMELAYERWKKGKRFTSPGKVRLTFDAWSSAWLAAVARERRLEAEEARRQLDSESK